MNMIQKIEDTPPKVDAWNYSTSTKKNLKKLQREREDYK